MAGLKKIAEYVDENVFQLKWKYKFDDDVGEFSSSIKINKERFWFVISGSLARDRDEIKLAIYKKNNHLVRLFFGEAEPMTYCFYRDRNSPTEEWEIWDRIFSQVLVKHTKEYRLFLVDKEAELYDKVTKFINELED